MKKSLFLALLMLVLFSLTGCKKNVTASFETYLYSPSTDSYSRLYWDVDDQTVSSGSYIEYPEFSSGILLSYTITWYKDSSFTMLWDFNSDKLNVNTTLYGKVVRK